MTVELNVSGQYFVIFEIFARTFPKFSSGYFILSGTNRCNKTVCTKSGILKNKMWCDY